MSNVSLKAVCEAAEKYGFEARMDGQEAKVYAKNTDGRKVLWFVYNKKSDSFRGANTDCLNIWLHETRPDLKAEDLLDMFAKMGASLQIYVDPEDWQEIAGVTDAGKDLRYTHMQRYAVAPPDVLRDICIRKGWFSAGSNAQYEKMFELNAGGRTLHDVALVIWICSDGVSLDEIENTMEAMGRAFLPKTEDSDDFCYSGFYIDRFLKQI